MKRHDAPFRFLFSVLLLASILVFVSCSSQMERDAKKMAQRVIEFEQVHQRFSDRSNLMGKPMSREELEKYNREYIDFATSMLNKYSETPEMKQEFYKMVEEKAQQMRKQ